MSGRYVWTREYDLVWDNASNHCGRQVVALGHTLAFLPPHSPELEPVERTFEELRAGIEGVVYTSLRAKQLAVEHHLRKLAADRQCQADGQLALDTGCL